jgi:hypothetical protein
MGWKIAIAVVGLLAANGVAAQAPPNNISDALTAMSKKEAQTALAKAENETCAQVLDANKPDPKQPIQIDQFAFFTMLMHNSYASRKGGIDPDVVSLDDQTKYLHDYCVDHPSDTYKVATRALLNHLAGLTAAVNAHLRSPQAPVTDLEAARDVRDYVVTMAPNWAEGRLKDNPDEDKRNGTALARDESGKIAQLFDFSTMLLGAMGIAYGPSDAPLRPLPSPGKKEVADVFIHTEIRDKQPGGNDNKLMRRGVPVFIIGDRGLDVWEIGIVSGVVSIRSLSWSVVGPWEPFQNDRTKYTIYTQRYLCGRTIAEDFPDANNAALVRAACAGDRDGIAAALKGGADANAKGVEGDAPLFWAFECGRLDSMEALLKAGADPNYRLTWAGPPSHIGGLPRQYSVLYAAVDTGNLDAVELFLKFGGDPNTYTDQTNADTALILAFFDDDGEDKNPRTHQMYETLLDADKDINRVDSYKHTIATVALESRSFGKLEELLKRGYDHDLPGLAHEFWGYAMLRPDPGIARVVALLKRKGVDVPPRPVFITVRMEKDGSLDYLGETGPLHILKGDPRYDKLLAMVGPLEPGSQKSRSVPETALPL